MVKPLAFQVTASPAIKPDTDVPVALSVAVLVPSYTLLVLPSTDRTTALGVMLPV